MNVSRECIDRWDKWEKFDAIKECQTFLDTREVPIEFNYIISECLIGDIVYEHSECMFCPYTIEDNSDCNCWGIYGQVLK